MTKKQFLLGIDQGSSGSRALITDFDGQLLGYGYRALARIYPEPDQVEQDPDEVTASIADAIADALAEAKCGPEELAAIGIACQRNTEFAWHAATGRPIGNAISWQDLRTVPLQQSVDEWEGRAEFRRRLGFYPGPYSSALHLAWRMRNDRQFASAARSGHARIGFSAEWLLHQMGEPGGHFMDESLVQATGLFDFREGRYWEDWLDFLEIPETILPQPQPTVSEFGALRVSSHDGATSLVPVLAMIGDQQAALFGHNCHRPGEAECTHGTASFVNVFAGADTPVQPNLNVYHAWHLPDAGPAFCLEADTTVTGAAIRWMTRQAGLLENEAEVGSLAATVSDSGGVAFVPAFTGLNVPHHDRHARGTLVGLALGTNRAHIARAFLESIGFQLRHIIDTVARDTGLQVDQLYTGGGLSASDEACQIQADLAGIPLIRPAFQQTTARAAALLAGFGTGVFSDTSDLPAIPGTSHTFEPRMDRSARDAGFDRWQRAVEISRMWSNDPS